MAQNRPLSSPETDVYVWRYALQVVHATERRRLIRERGEGSEGREEEGGVERTV